MLLIHHLLQLSVLLCSINGGYYDQLLPIGRKLDIAEFVDLSIKLQYSIFDGPGATLLNRIYSGVSISRQTFETQFIFDISNATSVPPSQIKVLNVTNGECLTGWMSDSVVLHFRIIKNSTQVMESLIDIVRALSEQSQNISSALHYGTITSSLDPFWGIVATSWDASLRLMFALETVDPDRIIDDYLLNDGSASTCEKNSSSRYCEFEDYFIKDLSNALDISDKQIAVVFVTRASLDAVLIHFRLYPGWLFENETGASIEHGMEKLKTFVINTSSILYQGNVTVRTDPTWGVSGDHMAYRNSSRYLHYNLPLITGMFLYYIYRYGKGTLKGNDWARDRYTQRRALAWKGTFADLYISKYNQSTASLTYRQSIFRHGQQFGASFFDDFEDWRASTVAWNIPRGDESDREIRGVEFDPFQYKVIGPIIPSSLRGTTNSGLVLNSRRKEAELKSMAEEMIELTQEYHSWDTQKEYALLDHIERSRFDSAMAVDEILVTINETISELESIMNTLNTSQCFQSENSSNSSICYTSGSSCNNTSCYILLNTSDATMTGVLTGTGIIRNSSDGIPVAIFPFDSIDLGPEVHLETTGQHPLVLLSRSSITLNTSVLVRPGTLGGFPGGWSIARRPEHKLIFPDPVLLSSLTDLNLSSQSNWSDVLLPSNNINGPGSGSRTFYVFTVSILSQFQPEVQRIRITTSEGHTLTGSFRLQLHESTTRLLSVRITAQKLKEALEEDLATNNCRSIQSCYLIESVSLEPYTRSKYEEVTWIITFSAVVGDAPELRAAYDLIDEDVYVSVTTISNGALPEGGYKLLFEDDETNVLPARSSNIQIEEELLGMSSVISAEVLSSSVIWRPRDDCLLELCLHGKLPLFGMTWTIQMSVEDGNSHNVSYPTSQDTWIARNLSYPVAQEHFDSSMKAVIRVYPGAYDVDSTSSGLLARYDLGRPFALAIGGHGGGFGGLGGKGPLGKHCGKTYGDEKMRALLGGSGGSMGNTDFRSLSTFGRKSGKGGNGGGSLAMIAYGDITVGEDCLINVDGEDGEDGILNGGGGGSGGGILISSAGAISIRGRLSASGGNGGKSNEQCKATPRDIPCTRGVGGGGGGGGGGGRIAIFAQSLSHVKDSIHVLGGAQGGILKTNDRPGGNGSLHMNVLSSLSYRLTSDGGAGDSKGCLEIANLPTSSPSETTIPLTNVVQPTIDLEAAQPSRIQFDVFLDETTSDSGNEGALAYLVHRRPNDDNLTIAFGIGIRPGGVFLGEDLKEERFDSSYFDEEMFYLMTSCITSRWLNVDIRIQWENQRYKVLLDGVLVSSRPVVWETLHGLRFQVYPGATIKVDNIFVGYDATLDFNCDDMASYLNHSANFTGVQDGASDQNHIYTEKSRHFSHLSNKIKYKNLNGGLLPLDGEPHLFFLGEFDSSLPLDLSMNKLHAGSLLSVKIDEVAVMDRSSPSITRGNATTDPPENVRDDLFGEGSQGSNQVYMLYREFTDESGSSGINGTATGGVGVCYTTDFKRWYNGGIALYVENATDMVYGSSKLTIHRPKVLYNDATNMYVMWMNLVNPNRSIGMAGVATSSYPDGPFDFIRSFFPDGNETFDQTVLKGRNGKAYLGRTYAAEVEYDLPEAVMQPMWESVKNEFNETDYGLNYHRAVYEVNYDDFHDIYLQRWRKEDQPWRVVCIDRQTGRNRTLDIDSNRTESGSYCNHPQEYKLVIGQGQTSLESRFKDPHDTKNNAWKPSSVPLIKAQPWQYNYRDGACGIRKMDDDLEPGEASIEYREIEDRSNCSNIADNPVHRTGPDRLIGDQKTVFRRRTNYIAISELTEDFLDTRGPLRVVEGILQDEQHLISLIMDTEDLGWLQQPRTYSTYQKTKRIEQFNTEEDWQTEYHQYIENYNDRAYYSLACALDHRCPVDFT